MEKQLPLISMIILAYNQEEFIAEAIQGAFSQTYSPLEIIISDDCSTDETYNIIQKEVDGYIGPHIVKAFRNSSNMGIGEHYNKTRTLAQGSIIIGSAGDDISFPTRVERSYELFQKYPQSKMICFEYQLVDKDKHPLPQIQLPNYYVNQVSVMTLHDFIASTEFLLWPAVSRAVKREIYDFFGPLQFAKDEDSTMFVRGLMLGEVCFSHEIMVMRRWHAKNVSNIKNIAQYNDLEFCDPVYKDIETALNKKLFTEEIAKILRWRIRQMNRILRDQYYSQKHASLYNFIYAKPANYLRRLKNKLF